MPVHTRVTIALVAAALLAAACGNRTGDEDAGPPEDESTTEPTDTSEGDSGGGATDVGVTGDTITIGVVADLTGVVPGLFKAAPDAVKAYAAKVNAEGGVNGRELVVEVYDTGTNDRGNAQAYEEACDEVFAAVGSESAFDSGGRDAIEACGFPSLPGIITDPGVEGLPFVFPRVSPDHVGVGPARWMAQEHPEAVQNAAMFYVNTPYIESAARETMEARESVGWNFVYVQPVGQLESNYTPHALEMKNRGVQAFAFAADDNNIIRLQQALREQRHPIAVADVSTQGYSQDYLEAAGPAGEGSYAPLQHALLEEADQIPALQEYVDWLAEVAPGEEPTSNGLTAWIRAKLFVDAATAVGDDLTRDALLAELGSMTDWDADGLIAPTDIGQAVPDEACFVVAQVVDGRYERAFPDEGFHCSADDVYEFQG